MLGLNWMGFKVPSSQTRLGFKGAPLIPNPRREDNFVPLLPPCGRCKNER